MKNYKKASLDSSFYGDPSIVNYHGCDLDTTAGGINKTTGAFTAKKKGIYRFNFQAHVFSGQNACVDIMKGSQGLARMCNNNMSSDSYNTMSNSVITAMEVGEQVHVYLIAGGNIMYSTPDKFIMFEGFFLAPF